MMTAASWIRSSVAPIAVSSQGPQNSLIWQSPSSSWTFMLAVCRAFLPAAFIGAKCVARLGKLNYQSKTLGVESDDGVRHDVTPGWEISRMRVDLAYLTIEKLVRCSKGWRLRIGCRRIDFSARGIGVRLRE